MGKCSEEGEDSLNSFIVNDIEDIGSEEEDNQEEEDILNGVIVNGTEDIGSEEEDNQEEEDSLNTFYHKRYKRPW